MKTLSVSIIFILISTFSFAQKSYMIHLTMDKIYLGKDSLIFTHGLTYLLEIKSSTDTIELGRVGIVPVAMVVDVRRMKVGEQIKYQIAYAFYKRENSKWTLIRKFPYTDRYELNEMSPALQKAGVKKSAHEEYHCSLGEPQNFAAYFRMDVYKK
jgi:hypothetical protein